MLDGGNIELYTIIHYLPPENKWRPFQDPILPSQVMSQSLNLVQKKISRDSSCKFMVFPRKPFVDTNHLNLQVLVISIKKYPSREYWPSIIQGKFQEVVVIKIRSKGIKRARTPWTTQLVHTGCIQATCIALALFGQSILHCNKTRHTAQL
ncbi:hypothetical protein O181_015996 [Austropuccinia psidii MF-1]|uniref:Uncharacterized protein n=1 Tax=Austropuccinia psidii MF-1 TaxID=1389203 RepID=A0A9Q3C0W2_9BASI|nr:hypothetical protein [Austropuccinia psidii MF-1]